MFANAKAVYRPRKKYAEVVISTSRYPEPVTSEKAREFAQSVMDAADEADRLTEVGRELHGK